MEGGLGAPFVNVYYKDKQLTSRVESFKYISSEEDDDTCELNIRLDDRNAPDLPEYQEGSMWTVIWGYIGGRKSHVRKIFCQEVKWEFDDQNLLLTASFTTKAVSLKQRSSAAVYKDTNIAGIAHEMGKVHGVKTYIEMPGTYQKPDTTEFTRGQNLKSTTELNRLEQNKEIHRLPVKVATTDELIAAMKKEAKTRREKDELDVKLFGSTDQDVINTGQDVLTGNVQATLAARDSMRDFLKSFNTYGNVAQGNKSDKQLLEELGKREKNGPFIADGTDDEVVIRKRHFDKPPYRSYEFGAGDGELISFQPESKNRAKAGTSVNVNYGGWDKLNKTYFNGDANVLSDNTQRSLAKYQKQYDSLAEQPDDKIVGNTTIRREFNLSHDATNVVKLINIPIRIIDKKNALKETIDYFTQPVGNNKNINDPTTSNPAAGFQNAANTRDEAELKNNPGYFEVIGDPGIEKGAILTFKGVSKKYSGNYYVTKCTHSIDGYKAYMVTGDIIRQGHNIRSGKSYVDNKQSGKTVNKQLGQNSGEQRSKSIPIKTNP